MTKKSKTSKGRGRRLKGKVSTKQEKTPYDIREAALRKKLEKDNYDYVMGNISPSRNVHREFVYALHEWDYPTSHHSDTGTNAATNSDTIQNRTQDISRHKSTNREGTQQRHQHQTNKSTNSKMPHGAGLSLDLDVNTERARAIKEI